jgi:hypothetical protein
MKTKVLAIALGMISATIAADVASARDAVSVSENGQVSIQRHRRAQRAPSVAVGDIVALGVGAAIAADTAYRYLDGYRGYGYSFDW